MIRALAALALLANSAWAQTDTAANADVAAASAADAAAPTALSAEVVTPAPVPTDPMELLGFALANARQATQCRFAFSRSATTAAQVAWSDADADAVIHFDPRLPIGQRFQLVRANRQQRAIQRSLEREDRKGLPYDLIALTVEGEWTYGNLTYASELPDRYLYSYTPQTIAARSGSDTGAHLLDQLIGTLEVSRETGRIISSTLREPPETAVRALGIVRVHHALLRSAFSEGADGLQIVDSGSQMMSMSAILTQTEVTTSFRYQDVEAICDPAEVARIAEAEAAAVAANAPRRR